jgi:hypothetical protein
MDRRERLGETILAGSDVVLAGIVGSVPAKFAVGECNITVSAIWLCCPNGTSAMTRISPCSSEASNRFRRVFGTAAPAKLATQIPNTVPTNTRTRIVTA